MDALHRLQFHIMQDEIQERWNTFRQNIRAYFTRSHRSRVGISLAETSQESEGRVWVEVGSEGLRLRVTHLHPANPSVSEALKRKCAERREAQRLGKTPSVLTGKLIYPPEDDKISLSSLEDYWFNHWQGPFITADSNQNSCSLPKLRRSHRKSKRSSRCSICQKKLVRTELEDNGEGQCHEREENILAHMPSVKLDTRVMKDDFEDRSDDEISKNSVSDDALSRISASDEHLSRMHRVVDNELRTSYSLFVDEAVSQDVIDATVSMDTSREVPDPSATARLAPPPSPRQSRSCPCSPKLSTRTCSPGSISSSPKSRSVGISKFSLSSSLLAIHRQASNSFVPEIFKFDSGKADSSGVASKGDSQQSSLRFDHRRLRHTQSDLTEVSKDARTQSYPPDESFLPGPLAKGSVSEAHSLPVLKLSKMSMTYRGGVIISEENEGFFNESLEDISEQGALALPNPSSASLPATYEKSAEDTFRDNPNLRKGLPDVVPESESLENGGGTTPSSETEFESGVVNLGFDGFEESSDFSEEKDDIKDGPEGLVVATSTSAAHESGGLALPSMPLGDASKRTTLEANGSRGCSTKDPKADADELYFVDGSRRANLSEEELCVAGQVFPAPANDTSQPLRSAPQRPLLSSSSSEFSPRDGDQRPPQHQQYNTFIEKDVMQEAREMVFWWRRKNFLASENDSEFCLHETECKVKQKPLLMFLHGIGSSGDVWSQQLWYFLSCGYEVVAPDLLGHGLSSAPRNSKYYSFAQMLEYVSLVFDLFVPSGRKCIVIGHNYGCALAVALARGRPVSVGLVVLASCGGPSPLVPHPKNENALNSTVTRILTPFISCGCLSRELLYTPRGKHYPPVASDDSGLPSTPRYVVEFTSVGQLWPEGDLAFHRRITIPTLLLYGMKDNAVSFVEMCEMEKTIPRAFLELIPGAGHELMTDCPEEVCHAMHRFIRRWRHNI